jgi:anti-sigma regulatory factor (Ser/Thr protein kinase)
VIHRTTRVFRGDLSGVNEARRHFKSLAAGLEMSEELSYQVELALVEVWTNIVRHAYAGRKGDFQVASWTEEDVLYFEVRDDGPPFDPRDFHKPDLERYENGRGQGGFGCFLISRLMDGVDYLRQDGENVLTLWKRLPPAPQ